jgi:hypothetical protein
MAYYPKSQVKTNLYTNGNEYALSTTQQEYTGYYYKTSSGKLYTGKNPQTNPTILLQIITPTLDDVSVNDSLQPQSSINPIPRSSNNIQIVNNSPSSIDYLPGNAVDRIIPQFNVTLPTASDKQRGFLIRYFCKKNNELIYFETSQADYDRIKSQDPSTAYDLYSVAALKWYITGGASQAASQNITQVNEASSINGWLGFIQYFQGNFIKYLES